MPHFVIEYSENLVKNHDISNLCQALFDAAISSENFDPDTVKVRALPCPYWRIGTDPQSFAHITIRLMAGRDTPTKSRLSKHILAAMDRQLPDIGSLTVDIKEIDAATYAKRVI